MKPVPHSWLAETLFSLALRAYPRAFRKRFGDEMRYDFRRTNPGTIGTVRTCAAMLGNGARERGAAIARWSFYSNSVPHLYEPTGRHLMFWDHLRADLRYAIRQAIQAPSYTTLAVVALAVGLGANSAVFTVVHGVLLRPLPYAAPDQLAMLWSENPRMGGATNPLSPANFDDLRRMSQSFEALDYALSFIVRIGVQGQEDQGVVQVMRVGPTLLQILGARAQLGRLMSPDERGVAVLSHRAWRARFGADPAVVGRRMLLSGDESLTIVGVASPEFVFPLRDMLWQASASTPQVADLWVPMPMEGPRWIQPDGTYVRSAHSLMAFGRLRHGITVAQADAELRTHARTLADRYPDTNRSWSTRVVGLHDQATGSIRIGLVALQAGIVIGLTIAVSAATATSSVLVGVTAYDATTYVTVPVLLLLGATAAAAAPAWRALRADPLTALRSE